ncbi:MAG: MFS transporter [Sinobacteraceae bacterium]|nr:MFS transporter [Nevskiaceae bacterium]
MGPQGPAFNSAPDAPRDGLPVPRRYWAVAAIALAIAMSVLDSSVANVALPTLAHEFHQSGALSIWIINAYQIAIVVSLLPLSAIGEAVGYRRVFLTGLLVFTLASLGCALSRSLLPLCLVRVVQGLGAAAIMSVSPALSRFTYPQRMLGRAVAINAVAVGISAALGPSLAAAVLAVASWPWLFAINVPLGAATFLIAARALPQTEPTPRSINVVAIGLNIGAFGLLICGLEAFAHRETTALATAQLLGGAALAATLWRHELHRAAPLIPFDLLRIPIFSLSLATTMAAFIAQMSALVALPFELQRLGHDAVSIGLLITPWPLALACAAQVAGRLADRYAAGLLGGVGLLLLATGLLLLALLPEQSGNVALMWRLALCGLGFGLFQAPNNRALLSAAPRARSGAAGGLWALARLLGQTLGAVTVALLLRADPQDGSHHVLWVSAGIAGLAMLASLRRLGMGAERGENRAGNQAGNQTGNQGGNPAAEPRPDQGAAATNPRYSSNGPSSGGPP